MNLSDNLKKIRKEHNLSQEQLAEKLGVSRQSVSKWESGQAYPEMDKMLQLCQMFNLNIDELLNQDVKEVNNNKQSKNNINKFINSFLEYTTKTVDMFCSLKFKDKIKCIFEQIIIALIMTIILSSIGIILSNVFENIFSILPYKINDLMYRIFSSLYVIVSLIFGVILLLHIFKIRYLDYYVIVKDDKVMNTENTLNNKNEEKEVFKNKKEKIIIRDPNHCGYNFISSLIKCFLFMIKIFFVFISFLLCVFLISLICLLVISFMFVKTGLTFVGIFIGLISLIVICIEFIIILYNFIINRRLKKVKFLSLFIVSLFILGTGIGLFSIGLTQFDIINDTDNNYFINNEEVIEMTEGLFFEEFNCNIKYIESDNKNIKILYRYSKNYEMNKIKYDKGYYFNYYVSQNNFIKEIRQIIEDINNKKIIDYSLFEVYIYTTKENIDILKENLDRHYNSNIEDDEMLNYYENRINDLTLELEEKQNKIDELENNCVNE